MNKSLRIAALLALSLGATGFSLAQSAASAPATASAPAAKAEPAAKAAPAAAAAGDQQLEGKIAYYGGKFNGRKTASGQRFNAGALTMAHKTLPFGTRVKVTNLKNHRSVIVRVNDRGPFQAARIGDVSLAAAKALRMTRAGVVDAKLTVLSSGAGHAKHAKRAKHVKHAHKK